MKDIFREIYLNGLVPAVKIKDAEKAVPVAEAIRRGGVSIIEIIFRSDAAAEAMVRFCRERVNPAHLKGILTAPWAKAFTEETPKANAGIRLFAAAKRKVFP